VTRRGVALLEVMLAIALLAMSGLVVLGVLSDATRRLATAQQRADAADLAASACALLSAGIATPETLNGPVPSGGLTAGPDDADSEEADWELAIDTTPAEFDGLVRVEITVLRLDGAALEPRVVLSRSHVVPSRGRGLARGGSRP